MAPRVACGTSRVPRRLLCPAIRSLIAEALALACAGCFLHSTVKPVPPTPQQLSAYAEQQTALRNGASRGNDEPRCDQLATATPGVEELRINRGSVESRQWTLTSNGVSPRWTFVRGQDGSPDGWAPKPGLDKLNFQPPVEPALTAGSRHFLAYAPVERDTLVDSQKSSTVQQVFGAAQGDFTWRGRKYSYTLTPELPCFPMLQ
jgi:hypothetical protein